MTALWINNPGFDTDHRHRGGMLTKTPPPTELQIPATVTILHLSLNELFYFHENRNFEKAKSIIRFFPILVQNRDFDVIRKSRHSTTNWYQESSL